MTINPDGRRYSEGVPPSGSGLRPDGLSQSSLSQAEPLVPNAVAFSSPLGTEFARLLIVELTSGKGTVRSLGVLYGLLMGAARSNDDRGDGFGLINRAIMRHFGDGPRGKLDRIKTAAWDFYERAASGTEAQRATTPQSDVVHDGPTGEAGDAQSPTP